MGNLPKVTLIIAATFVAMMVVTMVGLSLANLIPARSREFYQGIAILPAAFIFLVGMHISINLR